jgi:GT2 family glycosyltransferase
MLPSSDKIFIIILHYGNLADTLQCLSSTLKIEDPSYEIILIDNGTQEMALEGIAKSNARIHFLRSANNVGFSAGCNLGIRYAFARDAKYLLLLNNDSIVDASILTAFRQAVLQFPNAGIFGAKIYFYNAPDTIWYAGGEVDTRSLRCWHIGLGDPESAAWNMPKPTSYACGCALFIKRDVIEHIGLLDEAFFLIWEEIDWCYRARTMGYGCMFVPEAKVWHKISQAFPGGHRSPFWHYHSSRSRILFLKRHLRRAARLRFYVTHLLLECILWLSRPFNARHRHALKGTLHALIHKCSQKLGSNNVG